MSHSLIVYSVLALTVLSASAATLIALAVDTRRRPAASRLISHLMQIAILGAGTLTALATGPDGRNRTDFKGTVFHFSQQHQHSETKNDV